MSETQRTDTTRGDDIDAQSKDRPPREELTEQIDALRRENARLREDYQRATTSQYRRSAFALAGIGLLAGLLAAVVPSVRSVLLALAGTGLFSGVLVYYLTPERLVPESVVRRTFEAYGDTLEAMAAELGLSDRVVYVPRSEHDDVRVFLPQQAAFSVPSDDALDDTFVVGTTPHERGVSLQPAGAGLHAEFEEAGAAATDGDDLQEVAKTLADSLVEVFEVVDSARVTRGEETVTVTIGGGLAGHRLGIEHPIPSFLGVGLARATGDPVGVSITREDGTIHVKCSMQP